MEKVLREVETWTYCLRLLRGALSLGLRFDKGGDGTSGDKLLPLLIHWKGLFFDRSGTRSVCSDSIASVAAPRLDIRPGGVARKLDPHLVWLAFLRDKEPESHRSLSVRFRH